MSDKTLLFMHALTGLHPGSGTALGVVDLPVQRERHTHWPTIPGSSLKGVLRAECRRVLGRGAEDLLTAFGPEMGNASDHAGAVAFVDARILAFPVRSLTGVFAWVTCPAVLECLARDLGLVSSNKLPAFPTPKKDTAACVPNSPLIAHDEHLLLEEFEFALARADADADASKIADWIACHAVQDEGTRGRLRRHLAVLHDDDFTHFVRNATEVVARVGLDYESKTVRKGALFYEEYLPAETLFYSLVLSSDSRRESNSKSAAQILSWLRDNAPTVIQIGGGETVGKGLCAVHFAEDMP